MEIRGGKLINQLCGWIIGHKMANELACQVLRRCRMQCQIVQYRLALSHTGLGVLLAKNILPARFMNYLPKFKGTRFAFGEKTVLAGATDRPACNNFGERCYVLLRVAAVHSEGMQFENFACEIFIQADIA